MTSAARQPLGGWRNEACVIPITVVGLDLTNSAMRLQARTALDQAGAAAIDLSTATNGNAEGLRLASVTVANGVPTSLVYARVSKSTMQAVPAQAGEPTALAYALQIDGVTRMFGEFVVAPSPIDCLPLPGAPDPGWPARGGAMIGGVTLTIGGGGVTVQVAGADLIGPLVAAAKGYSDAAQAAVAATGANAADASLSATAALTAVAGVMRDNVIAGLGTGQDYFSTKADPASAAAILFQRVAKTDALTAFGSHPPQIVGGTGVQDTRSPGQDGWNAGAYTGAAAGTCSVSCRYAGTGYYVTLAEMTATDFTGANTYVGQGIYFNGTSFQGPNGEQLGVHRQGESVASVVYDNGSGSGNDAKYLFYIDGEIVLAYPNQPNNRTHRGVATFYGTGGAVSKFTIGTAQEVGRYPSKALVEEVQAKQAEFPSILDAGAKGDGVTDDSPAFAGVAAPVIVPRQDYYFGASQTIDVSMDLRPGARLIIPPGVTLTPQAGFRASSAEQIFVGAPAGRGAVDLRRASLWEAFPEWWGYGAADGWASAIEAALAAHPRVKLQASAYLVRRTVQLQPYARLIGQGDRWEVNNAGSLILADFANAPVVQAGPLQQPAGTSINDAPFGMRIEDLEIARSVAPAANDGCRGLAVGFSREFTARRVTSDSSRYSFSAGLSVHATFDRCQAKCSTVGALDAWVGFLADSAPLSAINSNASLYVNDCTGVCSPTRAQLPNTRHLRIAGKGTDFYQTGTFETVGGAVGVEYAPTGAQQGSSNDMIFERLVIDQYTDVALYITGLQNFGRVAVQYLYAGPTAAGAAGAGGIGAAVHVTGSGSLSIANGEAYMAAATSDFAIYAEGCTGSDIRMYVKDATNAAIIKDVTNSRFDLTAFAQDKLMGAVIKSVSGCTDNDYTARAAGGTAGRIGIAHQSLDATNDYNQFNLTAAGRSQIAAKTSFASGAETHSVKVGVLA